MTTEDINTIVERQLDAWPEARDNFFRLGQTERRPQCLGDLECAVQFNPARIRSTGASIDPKAIAERPCFLCAHNRPDKQSVIPWLDGWDFLVNPYPILPIHFTIVSQQHVPQDHIPLEMAEMAEKAPDLVFFFNGAHAGASAPDHLHVQAVLKSELPLMRMVESCHRPDSPGLVWSDSFGLDLPFIFLSGVITPDREGMMHLLAASRVCGLDAESNQPDPGLVNAFFWMDDAGLLRVVIIPRRAHRPSCYNMPEEMRLVVSPGAIDMAGLMIVPRREDFDKISREDMLKIYKEVAYQNPMEIGFE